MKRLFWVLIAFFVCYGISAKKLFIEMEFSKNSIKIDDGTNKKSIILKDSVGNDIKFRTLIGALNYMSLQGWELIDVKPIVSGGGASNAYCGYSSTSTDIYYIFSREVSDDELKTIVDKSYKEQ